MKRSQLLNTIYNERFEPIKIRSRRPNTKRLYRATLKEFAEFLKRPATLADLNDATVSRFAAHRLDEGLAKRTVNKDLFNLLAIWRWAHTKGYVTNWPDVEMETPPVRIPVALLREEVARVMKSIAAEHLPVGTVPGPVFWRALMLLIWDTAERIGAVMALTWDRVNLDAGWVRFIAEDRKGAISDNVLPIAADTCAALQLLCRDSGKVYRWPFSATYIYRRLGRIMVRAGLPDNSLYKFHVVRKSVASHYEAAGGNATALLKHSSRKVTEAYLDPRITRPVAPIDLLFRPGAG